MYIYDGGSTPIGMMYRASSANATWQLFWYEKNLQGDVVAVYNNNGVKHVSYTYDAWGNTTETRHVNYTAASYNPFRYRGYYYDRDIGLYCLGTRWYSTQFRRFLSPDDISYLGANGDLNSYNLYAYCSNNPVMYADPTGHSIVITLLIATGIGALIGGGIAIGGQLVQGNFNPLEWEWKNILGDAFVGATLGVSTAAGGLVGIGAVSVWAAVGLFAGTTALSFCSGAVQYALNYAGTDAFNRSGLLVDASLTMFQSMLSFGLGALMSSSGMWKSLNQGEFIKGFSSFRTQGNNFVKSVIKSTGVQLKNNLGQIIERAFVKNIFTIPYSLLKKCV